MQISTCLKVSWRIISFIQKNVFLLLSFKHLHNTTTTFMKSKLNKNFFQNYYSAMKPASDIVMLSKGACLEPPVMTEISSGCLPRAFSTFKKYLDVWFWYLIFTIVKADNRMNHLYTETLHNCKHHFNLFRMTKILKLVNIFVFFCFFLHWHLFNLLWACRKKFNLKL